MMQECSATAHPTGHTTLLQGTLSSQMEGTHAMSSSSLPTRGNYKVGEPPLILKKGALILIIPGQTRFRVIYLQWLEEYNFMS